MLAELRAIGEREDELYRQRVRARETQLGFTFYGSDRAALANNPAAEPVPWPRPPSGTREPEADVDTRSY